MKHHLLPTSCFVLALKSYDSHAEPDRLAGFYPASTQCRAINGQANHHSNVVLLRDDGGSLLDVYWVKPDFNENVQPHV